MIGEVLPQAASLLRLQTFFERGAFDAAQARRYLEAARDHGLVLRLHADQFTEAGGVELAIELGARRPFGGDGRARRRSARSADVTAVLLPASALFLGEADAAGPRAGRSGAAVALATDFNPEARSAKASDRRVTRIDAARLSPRPRRCRR